MDGVALLVLIGAAFLFLYLLPSIAAVKRRHRNRTAIVVLNVALGWTLLGWVAALVWAYTADVESNEPKPRGMAPASALGATRDVSAAERVCPFCAETVKAAAVVCKHCGRDIAPPAQRIRAPEIDDEIAALGIRWDAAIERFVWRTEYFKDKAAALAYAKEHSRT